MTEYKEIVDIMLNSSYNDTNLFVDFYNLGRGLNENQGLSTKQLKCWKIVGNELQAIPDNLIGIFYDKENYLIKWSFEFLANDNTKMSDSIFYYWKGGQASKGLSPLPPEEDNSNTIVERICQWSEPPAFIRLFENKMIVLEGTEFYNSKKRLFMFRGDLKEEVHLYEVPCKEDSLRNKGAFLLIDPSKKIVSYLYCKKFKIYESTELHNNFAQLYDIKNYSVFKNYSTKDDAFLKLLNNDINTDFTPKLFYFNNITGQSLYTLVQNPLSKGNTVSLFPFLQSHLYTATIPAKFLLDNFSEIWMWERNQDENVVQPNISKQIAIEYAKAVMKERNLKLILLKQISAGSEPSNFIELFPIWAHDENSVQKRELTLTEIIKI